MLYTTRLPDGCTWASESTSTAASNAAKLLSHLVGRNVLHSFIEASRTHRFATKACEHPRDDWQWSKTTRRNLSTVIQHDFGDSVLGLQLWDRQRRFCNLHVRDSARSRHVLQHRSGLNALHNDRAVFQTSSMPNLGADSAGRPWSSTISKISAIFVSVCVSAPSLA